MKRKLQDRRTVLPVNLSLRLAQIKETKSYAMAAVQAQIQGFPKIFTEIFNFIPVAITISDMTDRRFKYVNEAFCEMLGFTREEVIGKKSTELQIVSLEKQEKTVKQAMDGGGMVNYFERAVRRKDGTMIDVINSIRSIEIDNEMCWISALVDITERRAAEEQIRGLNETLEKKVEERTNQLMKKERQLSFTLDNMSEGVQIIDFDYKHLYANNSVVRQSKSLSKDELLGRSILQQFPGIENTEMFRDIAQCMKERIPVHAEDELVFPDQTIRWFELSIQPVPEGVFILSIDITDRKKAEEDLLTLNEQLEMKVAERTTQLTIANKELEAFSYSISHDLRSPLRFINGYAGIMIEDYAYMLDDKGKQNLQVIRKNTIKMGQLIDDLLEFSRLGKRNLTKVALDMTSLAAMAITELRNQPSQREMEIELKSLIPIHGDSSMIKQVMTNLISNAIKYSSKREKSRIEMDSYPSDDSTVYLVKDNGAGFDMKYYDKLFDVFQRLHSDSEFEGTGVGLALVQRIIAKHGGKIWAESKVNEGAIFYFSLPNH